MLSEKQLAEIEARKQKVTPWTWTPVLGSWTVYSNFDTDEEVIVADVYELSEDSNANTEFIAHSNEDITALLRDVRRLRAVVEQYADHDNWVSMMPGGGKYVWYPSENGMNGYTRAEECLREDGE